MSVYKLTCEKSGDVYYGATKNPIEFRRSKGHYNCSCNYFINPKLELVEDCDLSILYDREKYYIKNYPCVNKTGKGQTPPTQEKKDIRTQQTVESRKRIVEEKRNYCSLCEIAFQSPKKLIRHIEGYRHKLKNESYKKYGDEWRKYYLEDNKKRYNKNRYNTIIPSKGV
tara:strand:- start:291 stop:797 length:507 start_codon:yes stop_codon:yes gene_type:complete